MVEAEEVHSLTPNRQLDDPSLGRLRLQTEVGQQSGQPRQRGLRLPLRPAHHQRIIGIADQRAICATPRPVESVQVHVAEQRTDDSSNAVGNFCFEVSLSYRRVELPRRVSAAV